jgi:hypothetical protein
MAQRALVERFVQFTAPSAKEGGKPSHIVYAAEA